MSQEFNKTNIPQASDGNENTRIAINFTNAEKITLEDLSRFAGGSTHRRAGALSLNICCADGNRKSLKLSNALFDALGSPASLQVLHEGEHLILGEELLEDTATVRFSKSKTSHMIYSATLVLWAVEHFGLDFSNGRTSRSFQQIEVVEQEAEGAKPFARIDMATPLN